METAGSSVVRYEPAKYTLRITPSIYARLKTRAQEYGVRRFADALDLMLKADEQGGKSTRGVSRKRNAAGRGVQP